MPLDSQGVPAGPAPSFRQEADHGQQDDLDCGSAFTTMLTCDETNQCEGLKSDWESILPHTLRRLTNLDLGLQALRFTGSYTMVCGNISNRVDSQPAEACLRTDAS